jgi:hypothetical protein
MTTVVLSPLQKQGDVSKVPTAPTAVLLQGSSAPPTAMIPRARGSSTSPTATLACTQGSGTSLPDTLAHSYTPIVHLDPLLASIKGRSRALMREGHRAGGRADEQAHSLSPSRTLVTPTASASPWRRITRVAFPPLCSISRQPIWAGTHSDNFTRWSRDPPGSKRRHQSSVICLPTPRCGVPMDESYTLPLSSDPKNNLEFHSSSLCHNIPFVRHIHKLESLTPYHRGVPSPHN